MSKRKKAVAMTANSLNNRGKDSEKVSNFQAFDSLIDAYRKKSDRLDALCSILKERGAV